MQVYKERGWSLAEDHINFTIGRQSFTLGQPENAVLAFRQILTNDSRQTATQQGAFLREYLYVYKVTTVCNHVWIKNVDSISTLVLFQYRVFRTIQLQHFQLSECWHVFAADAHRFFTCLTGFNICQTDYRWYNNFTNSFRSCHTRYMFFYLLTCYFMVPYHCFWPIVKLLKNSIGCWRELESGVLRLGMPHSHHFPDS